LLELDFGDDIDQRAILNNKVSITPIHYDLTDYSMLEAMKMWDVQTLI
jgi:Predicted acid phosphatase